MRLLLLSASLLLACTSSVALAGELDHEPLYPVKQIELAKDLPAVVVVRTKIGSKEAEVFHSPEKLAGVEATKKAVAAAKFIKIDKSGVQVGELDRESSSSSWYFYCHPGTYSGYPAYGYYPNYYYGGYNYQYAPYWAYNYGGYNYNYYGWPGYGGYGNGYPNGGYGNGGYGNGYPNGGYGNGGYGNGYPNGGYGNGYPRGGYGNDGYGNGHPRGGHRNNDYDEPTPYGGR
jgi:hypothetical protein